MDQPQIHLADLCTDFFLLGQQIRGGNLELPACETIKRRVLLMFETFRTRLEKAGLPHMDHEDARYALAAYLDEVVQYADWPGKQEWARQPLQAILFGESRAGATFFQRLPEVRRRSKQALEVYYLCLVLGFQGEYRLGSAQELDDLIDGLRRDLAPGGTKLLSPHGKRPEAVGLGGKALPLLPIAGVALMLSSGIAVLLYFLLSSSTTDAVELLTQLGRS